MADPRWTDETITVAMLALARASYAAEGVPWDQADWDQADEESLAFLRRGTEAVLATLADAGLLATPEMTAVVEAAQDLNAHVENLRHEVAALMTGVTLLGQERDAMRSVVEAAQAWLAQRRSADAFVREPRAELIRLADAIDALESVTRSPQNK